MSGLIITLTIPFSYLVIISNLEIVGIVSNISVRDLILKISTLSFKHTLLPGLLAQRIVINYIQ